MCRYFMGLLMLTSALGAARLARPDESAEAEIAARLPPWAGVSFRLTTSLHSMSQRSSQAQADTTFAELEFSWPLSFLCLVTASGTPTWQS
jgi:hypothetical protein